MTNHNVRYPAKAKIRAQALRKATWSPAEIRRILEKEMGISPGFTTIRSWTDPRYDESRRHKARKREHARWLEKHPHKPTERVSPPRKLARMRALHDAGLSHWAIGVVAGVWWGEPLGERQVEYRLKRKDHNASQGWQRGEGRAA